MTQRFLQHLNPVGDELVLWADVVVEYVGPFLCFSKVVQIHSLNGARGALLLRVRHMQEDHAPAFFIEWHGQLISSCSPGAGRHRLCRKVS